jgi:hypothetical protein
MSFEEEELHALQADMSEDEPQPGNQGSTSARHCSVAATSSVSLKVAGGAAFRPTAALALVGIIIYSVCFHPGSLRAGPARASKMKSSSILEQGLAAATTITTTWADPAALGDLQAKITSCEAMQNPGWEEKAECAKVLPPLLAQVMEQLDNQVDVQLMTNGDKDAILPTILLKSSKNEQETDGNEVSWVCLV